MSQLSIILWELSFLPDVSELCIPEEYFDRTNEGAGTDLYQYLESEELDMAQTYIECWAEQHAITPYTFQTTLEENFLFKFFNNKKYTKSISTELNFPEFGLIGMTVYDTQQVIIDISQPIQWTGEISEGSLYQEEFKRLDLLDYLTKCRIKNSAIVGLIFTKKYYKDPGFTL